MVVASYYGGHLDDPEIDYTNWNEWLLAIKEDIRKFIDYRLCDISNSEKLIKELQEVSKNLSNTCPLGINYLRDFRINIGEDYSIIEYPVYDHELDRYNCSYAIISRDYREFIFVNSINSAPLVSRYKIEQEKRSDYLDDDIDLIWSEGTILETLCYKVNIVKEEQFVPGIDLKWDEDLIQDNLNYLRGLDTSPRELGGFAEDPGCVDGDYNAFNFCIASDYAAAMTEEDFERLGYIDSDLFKTIAAWLNYDGEINISILDFIKNIPKGDFTTSFNRTFATAICDRHIGDLAESLIYNGNRNPRLYFTAILYSEPSEEILDNILGYLHEPQEYVSFVNELMSIINQEYIKRTKQEQRELINILKPYLRNMSAAKNKKFLTNTHNFEWFDEVFGTSEKERKLTGFKMI